MKMNKILLGLGILSICGQITAMQGDPNYLLLSGAKERNANQIVLALDSNANINTRNAENESALFIAIRNGFEDIVRLLINREADVNLIKDETGRSSLNSPLILASYYGNKNIVKMLLEAGANVNYEAKLADPRHSTALANATFWKREGIPELLKEYGATK